MFTVLLRKASGAGYYAMAGLPYDPVVQLSTPVSRLSVMEGRTLAIASYNSKLDDNFEIVAETDEEREKIRRGMDAVEAPEDLQAVPVGVAELDRDLHPGTAAALEVDRHAGAAQEVAGLDMLALDARGTVVAPRLVVSTVAEGRGQQRPVGECPLPVLVEQFAGGRIDDVFHRCRHRLSEYRPGPLYLARFLLQWFPGEFWDWQDFEIDWA